MLRVKPVVTQAFMQQLKYLCSVSVPETWEVLSLLQWVQFPHGV